MRSRNVLNLDSTPISQNSTAQELDVSANDTVIHKHDQTETDEEESIKFVFDKKQSPSRQSLTYSIGRYFFKDLLRYPHGQVGVYAHVGMSA